MPRIPRGFQWSSEACFHLMDRGHNREAMFADDEDREAFLGLLGRYQSRFRFPFPIPPSTSRTWRRRRATRSSRLR
jgi:hypothetical protein